MKVSKSLVFLGDLNLCTEYNATTIVARNYKSELIAKDLLILLVPNHGYILIKDLENLLFKSVAVRKAPTYSILPMKSGDEFLTHIKPYYKNDAHPEITKVDINDLIKIDAQTIGL